MKIKIGQSKEKNTTAKHSELSSLKDSMIKISKHTSKHTKTSTNFTLNSLHINVPDKSEKDKKIVLLSKDKKQAPSKQKSQMTSGRMKKLKNKTKSKKSLDFQLENYYKAQNQGGISYREYCLVEDSFVPISSNIQQQKLQDMMRSTAATTLCQDDFTKSSFRRTIPFKLKQNDQPLSSKSSKQQQVFLKPKPVSKREVQIQACPFYEEIGIQYSQRREMKQIQNKQPAQLKVVQIDIQTEQIQQIKTPVKCLDIISPKKTQPEQSLSDLLLKLEFKHLPNQKAFQNFSKSQKEHYSDLLGSLISKLTVSPRESTNSVKVKSKQKIQIEEVQFAPLDQVKIKYEKLQMQIYKRQCYQMNWMQKAPNPQESQLSIDTSLLAVSSFLFNFFCYVQINFSEEFLIMIKKQYGPSYQALYQSLTRKITSKSRPIKVLDQTLYQDFCDQALHQISQYQKIHLKAVFDSINQLLDTYRPFYQHNGQPFPWSVTMYNNICQYAFDQNSLQIIFGEIKENLENNVSNLCGIIVEQKYYSDIKQSNPLQLKRNERQNRFIQHWLNQKTNDKHQVQCQATKTLYELSEQIYNQLLLQVLQETPLCYKGSAFEFIQ